MNGFELMAVTFTAPVTGLVKFIKAQWKKLTAFGFYQAQAWAFDNPVWLAVELKWHADGVWAMMFLALLINAGMLCYYRRKKVSWLGWDAAADFLEAKMEELTEMFFLLTAPGVLLISFSVTLLSSNPAVALRTLFLIYIIFESVLLLSGMLKTKWGNVVAFFMLSFWQDSFVVTAYLRRKDDCRDGLRLKDYAIFFLSSLVSIAYWAIRNGLIAEFVLRPILKV